VKASSKASLRDFSALKVLQKRLGDRFKAGVVFHTGNEMLPFGKNLWLLPIPALWAGKRD